MRALRLCKTICNEGTSYFYANNVFELRIQMQLMPFASPLRPVVKLEYIRNLRLLVEVDEGLCAWNTELDLSLLYDQARSIEALQTALAVTKRKGSSSRQKRPAASSM
jgi:hypothetical protein